MVSTDPWFICLTNSKELIRNSDRIVRKIVGNMNIQDKSYHFDFNLSGAIINELFKCFAANQVATIWAPPNIESTGTVKVE